MSKVSVTKDKLDILANAIANKSGEPLKLTLDEMVEAVDGIEIGGGEPNLQAKTYTVDSVGTETITADSGYDGLSSVAVSVPIGSIAISATGNFQIIDGTKYFRFSAEAGVDSNNDMGTEGYISDHTLVSDYHDYSIVPSGTSVTPTESAQTIGGMRQMMEGAVTVNAIPSNYVGSGVTQRSSLDLSASGATVTVPSGYYSAQASKSVASGTEGTPTATKGTVSNHSISVTPSVTNTAGYITGGTSTGTAVSVSASELVSGTFNGVYSYGTYDVTNYASVQVPGGSEGTPTATKGTVSNHSVSVTPSVTNVTGFITGSTKTGTAVTVSASELVSGSETKTANGTYDVTNLAEIVVDVQGGGSDLKIGEKFLTTQSASYSLSFTNLFGEPISFLILCRSTIETGASPYKTATVVYDGTNTIGQYITNTNNAQVTYDSSGFSFSYNNGTLTVSSTNAQFGAYNYMLWYAYGGSSSCVKTADVQVGSGATSITFNNLEGEPIRWACTFKSNFGTSSGYQRVIAVTSAYDDGEEIFMGLEMDSSAKYSDAHWTASYSNGSLTITSQGTNAGGYFHQPGYYQLTYAIDESAPSYQTKTVTPTTSQQVVTADSGYDALSQVTVNAMPSMTLPSSTSATSSGTSKATISASSSTQYLNIPTGYNATAQYYTISASGGGGGANIATETTTNSSNQNTSISFTLPSGRTPKAFFARLTSQIARNSNSRYYYVFDMRWDGSSNGGVAGNTFYMSSGTLTNVTSGYSYSQSGTTFTLSSTGSRSASPGSFYNGTYELVYIY